MKALLNAMKAQAIMAASGGFFKIGIVSAYDPSNYTIKALLQPDGNETGWIPVGSMYIGNGFGAYFPPDIGNLVGILFEDGNQSVGYVICQFCNDEERPPSVSAGEGWVVHKSGSFLKFKNSGDIQVHASGNIVSDATSWNHAGPLNLDGEANITGKVTGTGGFAFSGGTGGSSGTLSGTVTINSGDVVADGVSLKTHTHPGVQSGSSSTGEPE